MSILLHSLDIVLNLPIWYLVISIFIALTLASEIGFWIGYVGSILIAKYKKQKWQPQLDDNITTITNSSLALLALFLGFAFSSAMDHFEKNREAVTNEAITIAAVYRYSDLITNQYKEEIKTELKTYIATRLKLVDNECSDKDIKAVHNESVQERKILWQSINKMINEYPNWELNGDFISSLNEMIQAEDTRSSYLLNEVPKGLFLPIGIFVMFNGFLFGVSLGGTARRHVLMTWGMYILIALAVGIIADLDRPLQGFINIDQSAMIMLKNSILIN